MQHSHSGRKILSKCPAEISPIVDELNVNIKDDAHRRILGGARRGNAPPKVTFAPPSFS